MNFQCFNHAGSESVFWFCSEPVSKSVQCPEPNFLSVASRVQRPTLASRAQEFRYSIFARRLNDWLQISGLSFVRWFPFLLYIIDHLRCFFASIFDYYWIAIDDHPTPNFAKIFPACSKFFNLGWGSIVFPLSSRCAPKSSCLSKTPNSLLKEAILLSTLLNALRPGAFVTKKNASKSLILK